MWVEKVVGITRVIFPPKRKDGLLEHRTIKTQQGGGAQARFYLSGLELTLNNTTIYRKDLKERD